MKSIQIVILGLLCSCSAMRELSNVQPKDSNTSRYKPENLAKLKKQVRLLESEKQAQSCKKIGEVTGKDNFFSQGKDVAMVEILETTKEQGGNALFVSKHEKRGPHGHDLYGKAYRCTAVSKL